MEFDPDFRLGNWPVGTYTFDGPHTRYLTYEADDLVARGSLTPTEVRIASATATVFPVPSCRTTSGTIGLADPYPYRFVGTANGVDLRRVPKEVPVPHVESVLTFDYDVTGRFARPFITGAARFADSEFLAPRSARALSGRSTRSHSQSITRGTGQSSASICIGSAPSSASGGCRSRATRGPSPDASTSTATAAISRR